MVVVVMTKDKKSFEMLVSKLRNKLKREQDEEDARIAALLERRYEAMMIELAAGVEAEREIFDTSALSFALLEESPDTFLICMTMRQLDSRRRDLEDRLTKIDPLIDGETMLQEIQKEIRMNEFSMLDSYRSLQPYLDSLNEKEGRKMILTEDVRLPDGVGEED